MTFLKLFFSQKETWLPSKTSQTFPSFLARWVICRRSSESSRSVLYANGWCIIDPWIVFADRSPSVTLDQMSRLRDGKCYHWNGNMWIEGSFGSYRTIGSLETKRALLNGYFFPLLNSAENYSHQVLTDIAANEKTRSTKSIILIRWSYFENDKAEKQGNVKTIDN